MRLTVPRPAPDAGLARRPPWAQAAEVANPLSRYPHLKRHRSLWYARWGPVGCKVTAEDGTWGWGSRRRAPGGRRDRRPLRPAPHRPGLPGHGALLGPDGPPLPAVRLRRPGHLALSAVDLALWDLKGKLLGQPVYALLGGPAHDDLFCYATGNDTDWYVELGFEAAKLACPYGPADGARGLEENERLVARAREVLGPDRELMLDCWMAFDVEYTLRLAERCAPTA